MTRAAQTRRTAVADGDDPAPTPPSAADGSGEVADGTVAAAQVRAELGLTAHQLSEFTAGLELDVGPRPNHPRYSREAAHLMTAARTLRDVRVPLDTALAAVRAYRRVIADGAGWLACAPTAGGWLTSSLFSVSDLILWIRTTGGRGIVVDLGAVASIAADEWRRMIAVPA